MKLTERLRRVRSQRGVLLVAMLVVLIGAIVEPERAAASYLTAYCAVLALVLGMLLLVMIVDLSNGVWFTPYQPTAYTVIGAIPVLAVLFAPILLSAHLLYPWTTSPRDSELIALRRPYLTTSFALVRAVLYWIVWIALADRVRRGLRARRLRADVNEHELRTTNVVGILILALTMLFTSFDWLMARSADMSSSIYGFYFFAAGMVAALALLILTGGWSVNHDTSRNLTKDNLHAAGKLLVAFLLVWVYIAFAQYLIIWIANLPREIPFYAIRMHRGWFVLAAVLLFGHFAAPFALLLPRVVKRSGLLMFAIGGWLLLMHYLDMYWLLMPSGTHTTWLFFWLDAAVLIVVAGVTLGFSMWRAQAASGEGAFIPSPVARGHA